MARGGTIEYRTGYVLPDPRLEGTADSIQKGWDMWLQRSGALTTGIPVGAGWMRINHTSIVVTDKPDCDAYYRAAQELIHVYNVCIATRCGPNHMYAKY